MPSLFYHESLSCLHCCTAQLHQGVCGYAANAHSDNAFWGLWTHPLYADAAYHLKKRLHWNHVVEYNTNFKESECSGACSGVNITNIEIWAIISNHQVLFGHRRLVLSLANWRRSTSCEGQVFTTGDMKILHERTCSHEVTRITPQLCQPSHLTSARSSLHLQCWHHKCMNDVSRSHSVERQSRQHKAVMTLEV